MKLSRLLPYACALLAAGSAVGQPARSVLYPENWQPGYSDGSGHFLHDFSYAGYHNGERQLPPPTGGAIFDVTTFGADNTGSADATAAIQAAIDIASTSDAAGAHVVYLPAGIYRCDGRLTINAAITLRGAGPANTRIYFTLTTGMGFASHVTFQGTVTRGPDIALAADGVNQSKVVKVNDSSTLDIGDEVALGWVITDDFVAEHGMTGTWSEFNGQWQPFFLREIAAINRSVTPNEITLDVPLRYPAKLRDGASLRKEQGYLAECVVEDLALSNAVDYEEAMTQNQVHIVAFYGVKDSVIRNVQSFASPLAANTGGFHLQSSGFHMRNAKRVTVADCRLEKAENRRTGGNGYLFEVGESSEVLFRDCIGHDGRHNFIQNWNFGATGIVWLRCDSAGGLNMGLLGDIEAGVTAYPEYHHSLATANLVDSCVTTEGWAAGNRGTESSGAGHSATQCAFWNITGRGTAKLRSFNYGNGYVIGTEDITVLTQSDIPFGGLATGTLPEDFTELIGEGDRLAPRSLYEDQLCKRLGIACTGAATGMVGIYGNGLVEIGEALTLHAYGDAGVYQWYKDGAPIPGETGPLLRRIPAIADDTGVYRVSVETLGKALLMSQPFAVTVTEVGGVPALGGLGLGMLACTLALCAAKLRSRQRP